LKAKQSSQSIKSASMLTNIDKAMSYSVDNQAPSPENIKQKDTLLSMTGLLQ